MHEFVRRFSRQHGHKLDSELQDFPGTFRIYGIDRWPTGERLHVEFKTHDPDAAEAFLLDITPA